MYTLFVSWNCGMSYEKEVIAETIEELQPKMRECENNLLRYYVDKDGEQDTSYVCGIHRNILDFMKRMS